ncbi:sodium-dependent glucose transporter 1B-like [Oppia nitens]|uniref:sodium-dependent glucose transporter 1B-like n=1 Tax=Oppia nitens TaxID=1686743 RepID=UPI0023DAB572|nr:sodium-dependent glucose transporter 1B-like [Oppia nitens]
MTLGRIRYFWSKPELIYLDKYAYTCVLLMTHLIYSTASTTFGPTFVDLTYTLDAPMKIISLFPTVVSVGNILGTLFGLVFKYVNRQLTLICLLLLMAISSTIIPFTRQVWQLFICAFFFGIGSGAWITAYNVWLIEMWQDNSGKILFLSQVMYGIGSVLGPLIDSSYVTGDQNRTDTTLAIISEEDRRQKLAIPYMISGGIQIIFPTIMLIMFFTRKYENKVKNLEPTRDQGSRTKLFNRCLFKRRLLYIALIAVCLSAINSLDLIYFNFLAPYLTYIPAHLSASRAAELSSALGTAYTVGQAVNFFVAMFISEKIMIFYHLLITILSIVGLFFVQNSELGIWVLTITVGFGFSLLYPGILSFTGRYIEITNRIGTVFWFSCGAVQFIPPIILGQFIEDKPDAFIIIQIIQLLIGLIAFIIIFNSFCKMLL